MTAGSFRNLTTVPFEFHPRLNLIVGANGQGKTNILEALALSFGLSSFRTSDNETLLYPGSKEATVISRYALSDSDTPPFHVEPEGVAACSIAGRARRTYLDGVRVPQMSLRKALPSVLITAADRDRFSGSPSERRKAIDRIAFALETSHAVSLSEYERARASKSALLARDRFDSAELEIYEESLCRSGAEVLSGRKTAVAVLEEELRNHAERLAFPYPDLVVRLESDVPLDGDIHANLKRAVEARSREEKLAQRCLVGPHRNDVSVLSGRTPLGDRASSGEARLLLLAWTLAEIGLASRKSGLQPVFAFDDFDAEWDGRVLSRFAEALPEGLQVFLTSARAESVRSLFSQDGVVLEIENGAVRGRQSMTRPAREGQGPRLVA